MQNLKVLKFGGTSMGNNQTISQCVDIIKNNLQKNKVIVVVSALSGVTNELIELIELAKKQKSRLIAPRLDELEQKHKETLKYFVRNIDVAWQEFDAIFKELRQILTGISLVGDISNKISAAVWSYGERLSSWIMHYALLQGKITNRRISATKLIQTNSNYLDAEVDFTKTKANCKRLLSPLLKNHQAIVITGFIARDKHKHITTLGRGGSDYTASILGLSVNASQIEIWTDVDGVMSADPRVVPNARVWSEIEMSVMSEMAYVGAKVLHPKTIAPALQNKIPVYVKNTFNPKAKGTKIIEQDKKGLKGIVVKKEQAIIHLDNPVMLNQVGSIHNYSHVFADHNIPLDVCVTSEISVSFSINQAQVSEKLYKDLRKLAKLTVYDNLAKVCIVGSQIGNDTSILARIFKALKKYAPKEVPLGREIYTISNGASFNNITLMVDQKNADEILKILHKELF